MSPDPDDVTTDPAEVDPGSASAEHAAPPPISLEGTQAVASSYAPPSAPPSAAPCTTPYAALGSPPSAIDPSLPVTAQALAATAKDLKALRETVVDAASVGTGLWVTYLGVLFYLLIAAGSVTHRDLFFENPVKLPFLGVDLPLKGFFWIGPALFLVMHAYVLLHLVLLAEKVGAFGLQLNEQIPDRDTRIRVRRQLPSNILVQFLGGAPENREGPMGFMLRFIAVVSLILGPIALLVFFELQFLPYHDKAITWWHRIALSADIALLWLLWPPIVGGKSLRDAWSAIRRRTLIAMALLTALPMLLVFIIATFPGEWLDGRLRLEPFAWLHKYLVAGSPDFASSKFDSLWSNVLVLPDLDLIDRAKFDTEAKIEAASETMSLRGRHLEGIILINSKLRKADLTAAWLQNAELALTDMREARLECADPSIKEKNTDTCTRLQGAWLVGAQMQGASMEGARLQGAVLQHAFLNGTNLHNAQLEGADLESAEIRGADLRNARLEGANLGSADLRAADLRQAHLTGASLFMADLRGASLYGAQLQGVSLTAAQLEGADLSHAFLWRANFALIVAGKGVLLEEPITEPRYVPNDEGDVYDEARSKDVADKNFKTLCLQLEIRDDRSNCLWSDKSFSRLQRIIMYRVPEGVSRNRAVARVKAFNPGSVPDEMKSAEDWGKLEASRPLKNFEQIRGGEWMRVGCGVDGMYVTRSLVRRIVPPDTRFAEARKQYEAENWRNDLARNFLDEKACANARGLDERTKAKLRILSQVDRKG